MIVARGEEDLLNFQSQLFSTLTLWSIVSRSSELYSLKDDLIIKVIFQLKRNFDESEGHCSNCNCSVGYNYFRSEDSLKQAASGFKTGGTSSSGISIREFMDNYLSNFYFADFPYFRTKTKLSRHSLAHEVVDPEEFNFENAVNGIVILNEIFFNQEESK